MMDGKYATFLFAEFGCKHRPDRTIHLSPRRRNDRDQKRDEQGEPAKHISILLPTFSANLVTCSIATKPRFLSCSPALLLTCSIAAKPRLPRFSLQPARPAPLETPA